MRKIFGMMAAARAMAAIVLLVAACLSASFAQDSERQKKLHELAEIFRFKLLFEHAPALVKGNAPIIDRPSSDMPDLLVNFTFEKMLEVWQEGYGESITDEELDMVLAYYRSSIGQKDLAAQRRGLERYQALVVASSEAYMKRIMESLSNAPDTDDDKPRE
jgi:hypothetical protein